MIEALSAIEVVTLFVENLAAAKDFYQRVFGHKVVYADDVSSVMTFGSLMINLLQASEAATLVEPNAVARSESGSRMLLTIRVENVDSVCADLARLGVALLNGPTDRPWGRRTAAFADPDGNVWEVAQVI